MEIKNHKKTYRNIEIKDKQSKLTVYNCNAKILLNKKAAKETIIC